MKNTSPIRAPWRLTIALACFLAASSVLEAAELFWNGANTSANPAAGGTGNWNSANTWRTGSDTGAQANWTAGDNATLAGAAGTVTINTTSVSAGIVTINTTGYKITSTANSRSFSASSLVLSGGVAAELNLASSGGTWTTGGITFGMGSSLTISGNSTAGNASRLNINGTGAVISGGSITLAGTGAGIVGLVSTASGVTVNSNIANNSGSLTMVGANLGDSIDIGGVISGSAGVRFSAGDNGGAGTITLNAANSYSGNTQFNGSSGGKVVLGVSNGLSTDSQVVMGFSSGFGQTLDLNGFNQSVAALTSNSGGTGKITSSSAGMSVLEISGSATAGAFGLVIEDGSGLTALARSGTGTTTLTATNTYTGTTSITGGTLQVGSGGVGKSGTGETTLNGAGAVLAGSGMVDGSVTTVGLGTVKPGDSGGADTGTLTTNSLSFTPASGTTVAELQIVSNAAFDRLNVNGDLTLNANSNIFVNGAGYSATVGDTFTLIDWSGLLSTGGFSIGDNLRTGANGAGNEGNLDLPDIAGIGVWDISGFSGSGALMLTVVAVPEPSRLLLLLLGSAALLIRRRRR